MFVLRRKDNNRVFRLGEGVSVAFACRNMLAAKKAVAVVKEQYGVDCVPYKIEQPEMSKYWFLAYRNNHRIGPERGIFVICGSEAESLHFAGNLQKNAGKVVRPVPARV
jgi:hypothetical protein